MWAVFLRLYVWIILLTIDRFEGEKFVEKIKVNWRNVRPRLNNIDSLGWKFNQIDRSRATLAIAF